MKEFDFYATAGVIAPGMVFIVGLVILCFPDHSKDLMAISGVSLGSLGVGLILAYVAGQLLQAIGNAIEAIWWWCWGGMPTDWVRSGKRELIAPSQRTLLESRIRVTVNDPTFTLAGATDKHWYAITRQVYAAVATADRTARIDIFNGNYGLCRGIAAGLLVLLVTSAIMHWQAWKVELILAVLIALAFYRMHRFAVRYAREVFTQYLQLSTASNSGGAP